MIAQDTIITIDISDPMLGVTGGGTFPKAAAAVLNNGKQHNHAQWMWEQYRSVMRQRIAGKQVTCKAAEDMIALFNSGKTRREILAWFNDQIA